ncbi:MAG: formylglycine-generating enzyme family protein [Anaerolineaceae bacterium]
MKKVYLSLIVVIILGGCIVPADTNQTGTPQALGIGSTQISVKDGMVLVYVPAGEFLMGALEGKGNPDEHPQHTVTLDAFWIDQTEVTNGKYALCVADKACTAPSVATSLTRDAYYGNPSYDNYPVVYVHWSDAEDYCTWAGRRLPTEAEWEKAARGTEGQIFPWGNEFAATNQANFGNKNADSAEVGSYPAGASPYGALDMAGNVLEMTADWYDANYYLNSPSINPMGADKQGAKVVRSGSWGYEALDLRASLRKWINPTDSFHTIGFRCGMSG